jgi:rhodanese-related sulfurtransferase
MPKYRVPFFYEGASMSSFTSISPDKLTRLIGTAKTPALIDVRTDEDFAADPRLLPSAVRRSHQDAADWGDQFSGRSAIVVCQRGQKLSVGTAAWLRHVNVSAEALEGGFEGWKAAKLPLIPAAKLPPRDAQGRTVWVTRARPKVDRIACPWLIRRFVDANAVFLFVAPAEVEAVGERFNAVPFDIEKCVLEPPRRTLHLRRHDRGTRTGDAALVAVGNYGAISRYRAARPVAGSTGPACGVARAVSNV